MVAVVEELGSEAFLYCTEPGADAVTTQPIVARAEGLSASLPGDPSASCRAPTACTSSTRATGARL